MANDIKDINRETRQRIGESIRNARLAQNLSVRALEELTGINKNQICRVEGGRANVTIDTISTIADALNLSINLTSNLNDSAAMTNKLFKTRIDALDYTTQYFPGATTRSSVLTDGSDYDDSEMPNFQWQGETPALDVFIDKDTFVTIGWWEDGTDCYEITADGEVIATYNNIYDAREAFDKARDEAYYADDEREFHLLRNGEDITE